MIKRFRMVAGPNGSGKTTLVGWLTRDYAVNFYTMLNADDVFAQVKRTKAFFFDNSNAEMRYLASYEEGSGYSLHVPAAELPFWFRHNVNVCI